MTLGLTEIELAYIAGIVDGEGSITLLCSHAKRTRGRYVYPCLRIANTNKKLIDWFTEKIKLGSFHDIHFQKQKTRKPVYHVGYVCNEAIEVLKAIEPYLLLKKQQCNLILDLDRLNKSQTKKAGGYFW